MALYEIAAESLNKIAETSFDVAGYVSDLICRGR